MNSTAPFSSPLVSPAELHHALSNPSSGVRVIPVAAARASSLSSYDKRHIPGSVVFNLDSIKDTQSKYLMMLPTQAQFDAYMADLGIFMSDFLVIYDVYETGFYQSPRVAWMCQHFGYNSVYVLNNFIRYVDDGFPTSNEKSTGYLKSDSSDLTSGNSQLRSAKKSISFEELRDLIVQPGQEDLQIIDSRPSSRFFGTEENTDKQLPSGHIPNAVNIPFTSLLGPDKTLLPPSELQELFVKAGVIDSKPTVLYCNSGTTATTLDLALKISGFHIESRLYDGSWCEWADKARDLIVLTD